MLLHENLRIQLTKEKILSACWNIEAQRTEKYVRDFPGKVKTFQWATGESVSLAKATINGITYDLFLKQDTENEIHLCLTGCPDRIRIWEIGYDAKWTWRKNPNLQFEMNTWWNKVLPRIHILEDALNEQFQSEEAEEETGFAELARG